MHDLYAPFCLLTICLDAILFHTASHDIPQFWLLFPCASMIWLEALIRCCTSRTHSLYYA